MKKVILVCQSGISTSLLKEKMSEYIYTENYDITFKAISTYEVKKVIEEDNFDMLLFTPQLKLIYKSYLNDYKDKYNIQLIDMEDFNTLNIENILSIKSI